MTHRDVFYILVLACLVSGSLRAFETSAPEAQGVSSHAVLDWVGTVEREVDALHSFVLVRHGKVIAEGWWSPYEKDRPHMLYSLSKSFTSSAIVTLTSTRLGSGMRSSTSSICASDSCLVAPSISRPFCTSIHTSLMPQVLIW